MRRSGLHKGFSLVELLVVIAIISLLAALLLPSLRTALIAARKAACQGNMKQIITSSVVYCNDYDGMAAHGMGNQSRFTSNSYRWGEIELLIGLGYIPRGDYGVYRCGNSGTLNAIANPNASLHYGEHSYNGRGYIREGDTSKTIVRPQRNEQCANEGMWIVRHGIPSKYSSDGQFYTSAYGVAGGNNVGYYAGHVKFWHDPHGLRYVYDIDNEGYKYYFEQARDVSLFGFAYDDRVHDYDFDSRDRWDKWKNGNPGGKPYGSYSGDQLYDSALTHKDESIWPSR